MPLDYTQAVRSFHDAFAQQDADRLAVLLDPQIEWTSAENLIYADRSPYVGIEAVLGLLAGRFPTDWSDYSMSAGEILGRGDLVIASGRFRGTFKANGASINAQFVQVFQFKDDKIAKCQIYTDTARFKESISQLRSSGAA